MRDIIARFPHPGTENEPENQNLFWAAPEYSYAERKQHPGDKRADKPNRRALSGDHEESWH